MAKHIRNSRTAAELKQFDDQAVRAEMADLRVRLSLKVNAYMRKSYKTRIHQLEKILTSRSD